MKKDTIIKGRAIVVIDSKGKQIDDIDTDNIFHNQHLHITEINEMGKHAFGNLKGWENLPEIAKEGDILIVGKNFGAGSSRQQAVDCFKSLGFKIIVGESFGAIYKRNAINSAMPLLTIPDIMVSGLSTNDMISVDLEKGTISKVESGEVFITGKPMSKVQLDIYHSGSLFEYGKKVVN